MEWLHEGRTSSSRSSTVLDGQGSQVITLLKRSAPQAKALLKRSGPLAQRSFCLWPFAFRLMPLAYQLSAMSCFCFLPHALCPMRPASFSPAYQLCLPRETRKMFHWGAKSSLLSPLPL